MTSNLTHYGLGFQPPPSKRMKKKQKTFGSPPTVKTPFMVLSEKYKIINQLVKFEQGLLANGKVFYKCMAELEGSLYVGQGTSKKQAKHVMAERAVNDLLPPYDRPAMYNPASKSMVDEADFGYLEESDSQPGGAPEASEAPIQTTAAYNSFSMWLVHLCGAKGPQWHPKWAFDHLGPQQFKCVLTVTDLSTEAEGSSKKDARDKATKAMLAQPPFKVPEEELQQFQERLKTLEQGHAKEQQHKIMQSPSQQPLSILQILNTFVMKNNLKPEWSVDQVEGQVKPPKYKAVLTMKKPDPVHGEKVMGIFDSVSISKKNAKQEAAVLALKDLFNFEATFFPTPAEKADAQPLKRTIDSMTRPLAEVRPPPSILNELVIAQLNMIKKQKAKKGEEGGNPSNTQNEPQITEGWEKVTAGPKYDDTAEKGLDGQYAVKVSLGDWVYEGKGPSKKIAKTQAARKALLALFQLQTPDPQMPRETVPNTVYGTVPVEYVPPATMADMVAALVKKRYLELCQENMLDGSKYLAGFVVTSPSHPDGFVVSIATGAGTVQPQANLGQKGLVIFDSNAPTLARRGFMLFLYQQLTMALDPLMAPMSLLEASSGGTGGSKLQPPCKLKEGVQIHFYQHIPPSGDARVIRSLDPAGVDETRLLRSYVETGASLPVRDAVPQNFIQLTGDQQMMRIMSASDKVLKWLCLGIQGALLSHLMDPIYPETLVIGTGFYREPLIRAVYGRIVPHLGSMSSTIPQPLISDTSMPEHLAEKPPRPETSMLWTSASPGIEILNPAQGKHVTGQPSCVCKQFLFEQFGKLYEKAKPILGKVKLTDYRGAKKAALRYQEEKDRLLSACEHQKLGRWQTKPVELENFSLPWLD